MRRLLLLVLLGSLAGLCGGLRVLSTTRTRRSMRSRLGGPFVRCMADGEEGEGNGLFGASGLFGTNRNTPEARLNQLVNQLAEEAAVSLGCSKATPLCGEA